MRGFKKEEYGYSVNEVNKFVSDTIVQLEAMIERVRDYDRVNSDLVSKNHVLAEQLEHYKDIEETLKRAVYSAEEASNNIKKNALEEANLVVREAKQNASRIVNDSLLRAEKVEIQAEQLEKNLKVFKRKLKLIIEQQMTVIDEIDEIELK